MDLQVFVDGWFGQKPAVSEAWMSSLRTRSNRPCRAGVVPSPPGTTTNTPFVDGQLFSDAEDVVVVNGQTSYRVGIFGQSSGALAVDAYVFIPLPSWPAWSAIRGRSSVSR